MPIIEKDFLDLTRGLDAEAFWRENETCSGFNENKPRCFFSFSSDDHWLFEFLEVDSTVDYYLEKGTRDRLHAEANAVTREYAGQAARGRGRL